MIRKLLALFVLFLLGASAQAATATVSWTNPTTYTNGTSIPAGALTGTRVEWGSCAGTNVFGTKAGEVQAPAGATSVVVSGLADATTYCFRAYARTALAESAASNVSSKLTPSPVPNPPVLSSTITVAYEVVLRRGQYVVGRDVGRLPIGTPCGDQVTGNYYKVDIGAVDLYRAPKSSFVVTQCEAA